MPKQIRLEELSIMEDRYNVMINVGKTAEDQPHRDVLCGDGLLQDSSGIIDDKNSPYKSLSIQDLRESEEDPGDNNNTFFINLTEADREFGTKRVYALGKKADLRRLVDDLMP